MEQRGAGGSGGEPGLVLGPARSSFPARPRAAGTAGLASGFWRGRDGDGVFFPL